MAILFTEFFFLPSFCRVCFAVGRSPRCCAECYRVVPGFQRVLPGFTGFYRVRCGHSCGFLRPSRSRGPSITWPARGELARSTRQIKKKKGIPESQRHTHTHTHRAEKTFLKRRINKGKRATKRRGLGRCCYGGVGLLSLFLILPSSESRI